MRLTSALLATTLALAAPAPAQEDPGLKQNRLANSHQVEKALLGDIRKDVEVNGLCEYRWRVIGDVFHPIDMGTAQEASARERLENPRDEFFKDIDPITSGYYFRIQQVRFRCIRDIIGENLMREEQKGDLNCKVGAITSILLEDDGLDSNDINNWLVYAYCL